MPHDRLRLPQRARRPGRSLRHEPCFKKRRKRRTSTKRRSRLSDRNKLPQTSNSLGLNSPHSSCPIRDTTSERINTRIRTKLPRPGRTLAHRPRRRVNTDNTDNAANTDNSTKLATFIVVARFKPDTDMSRVMAVVAEEAHRWTV